MRWSLVVTSFGAAFLLAVFLPRTWVVGQEGAGAPAQPFKGKFLAVVKKSDPKISAELQDVQLKKLEGRTFIVGTGIDVPGNWQKGLEVWVALDDVSEITVFATLEDFQRGLIPPQEKAPAR